MASWTDRILDLIKPAQSIDTHAPAPAFKGPIYAASTPQNTPGLIAQGNTDLAALPIIRNPVGTFGASPGQSNYSTVHSMGFTDENPRSPYYGKEVLARGIVGDKTTDDANAVRNEYYKTGKHLGIFSTPEASDVYGEKLHNDWASGFIPGVKMGTDVPVNAMGLPVRK